MNDDEKYKALVEKNQAYDGVFYTAVLTTGIFCRTVCTARKPKRENVAFYDTVKDAMAAGFRPCKICRPLEGIGQVPLDIQSLIAEVEHSPEKQIKAYELKLRGYNPATVRRWFQKHYGMTFSTFSRLTRMNNGLTQIKRGENLLEATYGSGYSSVSGFTDAFNKAYGSSPMGSIQKDPLLFKHFDTALGPMIAVANSEGLVLLEFGDRRMLETELKCIVKQFKSPLLPGLNSHIQHTMEEISAYFKGELKQFTIPLVIKGTDFQKRAWMALKDIPYGVTKSYLEQAVAIGQPTAVRAIGTANGMNKLAIVIPCHRVIGHDGKLTGYGGGLWRKEKLLNLERGYR